MATPEDMISYQYQSLLHTPRADEEWTPTLELQSKHFLTPQRVKGLMPDLEAVHRSILAELNIQIVPDHLKPLDCRFIDLPDRMMTEFRQKRERSELSRILDKAHQIRQLADRVLILGIGGSYMGARALFDATKSCYHNELPQETRAGTPKVYFEGNNLDNDAMQDLIEMLQTNCVNPDQRSDRWATIAISKSGNTIETSVALRVIRKETRELFSGDQELMRQSTIPVTGKTGSRLRDLFLADGYIEEDFFTVPEGVGGRYSVFTPVGLLPAAVMGLDVHSLLLGAQKMTRWFMEQPFDSNPVLQYAAVNYLMAKELGKPIRVMSIWSKKLEALGWWYDQLLAESLGKNGMGPTPITSVQTRDLHSRGQQYQEGARDKMINNLVVLNPDKPPLSVGMADRNEDDLNQFSRKKLTEVMISALNGTNQSLFSCARPYADILLPSITEHTLGQLMQMLMLATVVEGKLMGVNPYGQPGVQAYKRNMMADLANADSPTIV
jgi:glucose-6-phosphate isomerase